MNACFGLSYAKSLCNIEEIIDQDAYTRVIYYLVSKNCWIRSNPGRSAKHVAIRIYQEFESQLGIVKYFEGIKEETNPNKKFKSKEGFLLKLQVYFPTLLHYCETL